MIISSSMGNMITKHCIKKPRWIGTSFFPEMHRLQMARGVGYQAVSMVIACTMNPQGQ